MRLFQYQFGTLNDFFVTRSSFEGAGKNYICYEFIWIIICVGMVFYSQMFFFSSYKNTDNCDVRLKMRANGRAFIDELNMLTKCGANISNGTVKERTGITRREMPGSRMFPIISGIRCQF